MHPPDLLLASQSPRRRELLRQIGVRFEVVSADIPEIFEPGEPAQDYVRRLALAKSRAGAAAQPNVPVLGADTVVVHHGRILEKPRDRAHALEMLVDLAGDKHEVITCVALCQGDRDRVITVSSEVHFRAISEKEAERYWATGEPLDKAGGYGIQGFGAIFVSHLIGSYSNVVGLPLMETQALLEEFQVPVWGWSRT